VDLPTTIDYEQVVRGPTHFDNANGQGYTVVPNKPNEGIIKMLKTCNNIMFMYDKVHRTRHRITHNTMYMLRVRVDDDKS